MKVIVTGGAGFIGSHLVELLISLNHEVTVLDNLSTGHKSNLSHIINNPRLTFVEGDVNDLPTEEILWENVDWVFHLSALADIVPSIEHPMRYHHANVTGTLSVLRASQKAGVKRFVYAASSSCYGIPDSYPTPESACLRPLYPYALTKMVGEQYVQHWHQVYDLPTVSLRLFNVYGPRVRTTGSYGAVFGVFLAQKLHGKPFTVVGDGTQKRDFVYVTDVAKAFLLAAESEHAGVALNVGSTKPQSVNRLVELLGGQTDYIPKRPGEPDKTFADVSRIKKMLGWTPKVSFEEGVQLMLNCIDDWQDAPIWDKTNIEEATRSWFRYLKNE